MNNPVRTLLLAVSLLAPAVLAQPLYFGDAVPLTHTRYGASGAEPRLVTNGSAFFLFWATESKVRVTRLVDGQKRGGRPVLDVDQGWFDVVWTGSHFLVVAQDILPDRYEIRGRLLDANGEPLGDPFTIALGMGAPRLAFDGARVLLVYGRTATMHSMLLRSDGMPATNPRHQQFLFGAHDAVVAPGGPGFVTAAADFNQVNIFTFQPTGDFGSVTHFAAPPISQRRAAVASNGRDVLAVWTNGSSAAEALLIRANGTLGTRTPIAGTEGAVSAAVVWNGTNWIVSTVAGGTMQSRILDGATLHAPVPKVHASSSVSLAVLNGRVRAAWRGDFAGQPVYMRDLTAAGSGETAAFAAAEQTFHTATWSHDAALSVWSEVRDGLRTLHVGARTVDGQWLENKIGADEDAPLASSDGNNFLVVKQTPSGWSAATLSNTLQVLASTPVVTAFRATGIAWDGTSWVIIGVSAQSSVLAVRVMPWGAVSAPVLIQERRGTRELENPKIMWGGGSFLAVWQDSDTIVCMPVCDMYDSLLHGARLTGALQRIDTTTLEIAPDEAVSPDIFWDGNRYVIFWVNNGALETRTVRPNASGSGITRITGAQIDTGRIHATLTPFGAAITSGDGEMLLIRENTLVGRYELGIPGSNDALVNLGARVAYVQASTRDEMPYHGASHLMFTTGGVLPKDNVPIAPQIVRASMIDGGNLLFVQWTPPLDAINGYRLEYRVDDGTWNELDQWFGPQTTSVEIRPWLENVQYQFRIRAWSDDGVSEYSRPATVRLLGRRRAMR